MTATDSMPWVTQFSFELTPEQQHLVEVIDSVASRIRPGYLERDHKAEFPREMLAMLGGAGLLGLNLPVEAGGQGAGNVAAGIATERLSTADFLAGQFILQASAAADLLYRFAEPEVAGEWLPKILGGQTSCAMGLTESEAGSDLKAVRFRAEPNGSGWTLHGEKTSVSFPDSQVMVLLAKAPDGPGLFLVPVTSDIEVSRYDDMGNRSAGRSIMRFDGVKVGPEARLGRGGGLSAIFASLTATRLLVAMTAVGIAQGAWDDMAAWSKDRVTFGKPLATRQGIAFNIVDHAVKIEMARLLITKGLWLADQGKPFALEAAMAKAWVPRAMFDVCHDAVLTVGHIAYTREHPAQLRLRDVLSTDIGEGMANVQRLLLSRLLLGTNPG